MDPTKAKANYSRVCQLLVKKGSVALRNVLHLKHPRSTLATGLNANKPALTKLRYRVINASQWDLLFPTSGAPDSNNFDITLLTILLRNICGLSPPTTGWDALPLVADSSTSADIVRIKTFRNDVYGHMPSAQFDDTKFHVLWQDISKPLIRLGILQRDIDEVKHSPLSPEEEIYIEELKKWKELDDDIVLKMRDLERKMDTLKVNVEENVGGVEAKLSTVEEKVDNVDNKVVALRNVLENATPSQVDKLAKFDFTGKINSLCQKFYDGTRQWLLDKLSKSLYNNESQVIILTASPGFGKSVLLAKVCEMYKQSGQLAASHFCDFRNSDYSDPHKILQSLASQMCENVDGFKEKLSEALRREHSRDSLSDAFRVLINDPLHALSQNKEMLIVVDALDESKTDAKNEFLELISEKFSELPKWVKILISSRPEGQLRKTMPDDNTLEIYPHDPEHRLDLEHFIQNSLPTLQEDKVKSLVDICQGSFLYAYFVLKGGVGEGIDPSGPKGISGFYDKQFKRFKTGLQKFKPNNWSSNLKSFINVVATSREPLPAKILFLCMGLSDEDYETREFIFEIMSEIIPVYDGCLSVYHKSLWDWLTLDGYEEHAFVADIADGNKRLWRACKHVYSTIQYFKSVSDVQLTPDVMYSLNSGAKYLLTHADDVEDLHWLVSVRINYLKLKFCSDDLILNLDFRRIVEFYKSKVPDLTAKLYLRIIQLHSLSESITKRQFDTLRTFELRESRQNLPLQDYLQFLASEYFEALSNFDSHCTSEAEDILNLTNEVWVVPLENRVHSSFEVVSHAITMNHTLGLISSPCMDLSPDNNLFAFLYEDYVQVFKLPNLEISFKVKLAVKHLLPRFVKFSPDSSYILCDSIRSCVSLRQRKEVPFFPDGPEECLCCSFSSCGKKFVSSERNCIKMWDVERKTVLVQVETKVDIEYCFFSNCGSFILARPWEDAFNFEAMMNFDDFVVLQSLTLKKVNNFDKTCVGRCLTHGSCYQLFSPPPLGPSLFNERVKIRHYHLPIGEIVLIANKHCTKPFIWKERSCVAFSNSFASSSELLVYDYVNEEIIEYFHLDFLPGGTSISYMFEIFEESFLVCTNSTDLFILSFETPTSAESFAVTFVEMPELKCCAISPNKSHLACCYESCSVAIKGIDSKEIVQAVRVKRQPEACWWSQSYLWIVCKGVVVKFPCDWTKTEVLGNENNECVIDFEKVLKFDQGILVIKLPESEGIAILKLVDEKLCCQEIPDSHFDASSVAISSDGGAALLYRKSSSNYQMWEKTRENRWELLSDGKLDDVVNWFCLTGREGSRSSLWLMFSSSPDYEDNLTEPLFLYSIDFPSKKTVCLRDLPLANSVGEKNVVYVDANFLVIIYGTWLYYIAVSTGACVAKFCLSRIGPSTFHFYISSRRLLLLVRNSGVKSFKIHNVERLEHSVDEN